MMTSAMSIVLILHSIAPATFENIACSARSPWYHGTVPLIYSNMQYEARTFQFPEIPGLSAEQLSLHIGLYEGYVKHVNILTDELRKLSAQGDEHAYAVAELRRRLGFEWNGMRLHELYFEVLEGGPQVINAESTLYTMLTGQFGSLSAWQAQFAKVAARGPGWAILNYDPVTKQFLHTWVADHEIGQLATLPAVLVLDHWEHAYFVDYKPAQKGSYVEAYQNAINWTVIADRFEKLAR